MLKKPHVKEYIRFVIIATVILCLLSGLNITNFCYAIFDVSTELSHHYSSCISKIWPFLVIELILIIVFNIAIIYSTKKVLRTEISYRLEEEKLISAMQKEMEEQNKLIDNLSNLYKNFTEFDKQKTEFLSNLSHELRIPLTVILGAIQLIELNPYQEYRKSSKHMKTIKQNCYRLLKLVNNILDSTRIDAGYITVHKVNTNIVYLIEEIVQSVALYAEQKNLTLEFDTESEEIITAVDVDKIDKITLNLLSNAIKFTPSGGSISVNIHSNTTKIIIAVKDTGIGIPKDKQDIIFERFKQVNNELSRQFEGSGIGLSLVKSFVELHDGNIRVHSEEFKGSEFIIELPIQLNECFNSESVTLQTNNKKIIEAINIEFSDIYSVA